VIGVHNGVIVNDDDLFDDHGWDRIAEVDSEAIFQLLADPSLGITRLGHLIGRAAIAWFDVADATTLHLARLEGSPLVVGHTLRGSVVFASTEPLLKAAANKVGLRLATVWHVPEFFYIKVVNGKMVERTPLEEYAHEDVESEWFEREFIN
jgi:glucosamine 6-phosphate synthetase-like amidotransferase/phosphosugar isomerase protein